MQDTLEGKSEDKTISLKIVMPEPPAPAPSGVSLYQVYSDTLAFVAKIALPVVLLSLALIFRTEISALIPNVSGFNFLGVQVDLTPTEKQFIQAVNNGDEDTANQLASKVSPDRMQTFVDLKKAALESSNLRPAATDSIEGQAVDKSQYPVVGNSTVGSGWKEVMAVSWVKPNDIFGRVYYLQVDTGVYLWPLDLDQQSGIATVVVNTSSEGRKQGTLLKAATMKVGEDLAFSNGTTRYKIKLVDINTAGKIKTLAAYFSALKYQG